MNSHFTLFPIFFLILAITAPLHAQEPTTRPEKPLSNVQERQTVLLTNLSHSPWLATPVKLIMEGFTANFCITALKTTVPVSNPNPNGKAEWVAMTVFVSPLGKNAWFGPEKEFYIQTTNRIVSCQFKQGILSWGENLLGAPISNFTTPIDIIHSPEQTLEWSKAMEYLDHPTSTDLRSIFSKWAFIDTPFSSFRHETMRTEELILMGDILKAKSAYSPSDSVPEAWIDMKTLQVIRAFENGKEVFLVE